MNEFKIGINALYRSNQETEWLKNNLQQAEENYKNTLATAGIQNLLLRTKIGKNRQDIQESRQKMEVMKTSIMDMYNQMTNRTANTQVNQTNAITGQRNADTNKLNQMNNVDRLDFEHQKLNVMKSLQEQGLSIQES